MATLRGAGEAQRFYKIIVTYIYIRSQQIFKRSNGMPKRKPSIHQPSLFPKRIIPQMPDDYYSSGPNPNLRRFMEEHVKPYDTATDDYHVPPFDKPRRIKHFANALIDGVPPLERDEPENAATLADWIRQCRRAGLFEFGRVLYEKGRPRFDELSEETQLLVEEDYQICLGRSGEVEKEKWAKRKKKVEQTRLFQFLA